MNDDERELISEIQAPQGKGRFSPNWKEGGAGFQPR